MTPCSQGSAVSGYQAHKVPSQYLLKAAACCFLAVQLPMGSLGSERCWTPAAQNFMENERVAPGMRF